MQTKLDKLKRSQVQKNLKSDKRRPSAEKRNYSYPLFSREQSRAENEIWELIESLTGGEPSEESLKGLERWESSKRQNLHLTI